MASPPKKEGKAMKRGIINEKFRNGWDYCLHAKISGDEYDICFTAPDDYGKCSMYIINQDDGIYILDAGTVYKVNDGE